MAEDIVIRLSIDPAGTQAWSSGTLNGAADISANAAGVGARASANNKKCPNGLVYSEQYNGCIYERKNITDPCPNGMKFPDGNPYSNVCVFSAVAACRPGTEFNQAANGCVGVPRKRSHRPGWGSGWGHGGCGGGWNRPGYPTFPTMPGFPRCPSGYTYHPVWNSCLPSGIGGYGPGFGGYGPGFGGYGPGFGGGYGPGFGGGYGPGFGGGYGPGFGWGNGWGWGNNHHRPRDIWDEEVDKWYPGI